MEKIVSDINIIELLRSPYQIWYCYNDNIEREFFGFIFCNVKNCLNSLNSETWLSDASRH